MSNLTVDSALMAKMFLAGAKNLEAKKEWINDLNVFPVPDGDTGTNMTMTIMSAAKDVASLCSTNDTDMMTICKAISSGSLKGARGNSGVILSQLLRGFCKTVRDYDSLDIKILAEASTKGVETAYKAVMKPKEGTILTVAKGISEKAVELSENGCEDLEYFFSEVIKYGDEVLEKTPDMLPVLKQAGVVDSGGQGLMQVLKGAYDAFLGKEIDLNFQAPKASNNDKPNFEVQANAEIKFGYCTEFIIMTNKQFNVKMEIDFKEFLESIGDSIVCVADDDVVKVHVHTNDPGLAIQRGLKYGQLSSIKIDNMRLEHEEKLFKQEQLESLTKEPEMEHKDVAFIAVSVGDGINEIFKSLGVDYIIEGGQTMNPSTEDMLNAIEKVNADTIYILPNNKNIIMAANQAKSMTEDKDIIVIPTKTVPQGITAVINYVEGMNPQDNAATMECEIKNVSTGQITYAVRDTMIDDKEIHQGDYMGIGDAGILSVGTDELKTSFEMIDEMMSLGEYEIISIYYGSDVTEENANKLADMVREKYSDCDVDIQYGGQPIYYYIVSCE
ncbi:MAG: DAK2 domain-containing protein [Lachnospiraceae bacterium]|nr:DAK2 domain-containing protein [Lachnospiraceae bacterium]